MRHCANRKAGICCRGTGIAAPPVQVCRVPSAPVITLALAFLVSGCSDDSSPTPSATDLYREVSARDPNLPMAERLKRLAEDVDLQHTPYSNDLRVELIERKTAASSTPPPLMFQVQYAVELLRAGRSEDALRQVDRLTPLVERDPEYSTPRNRRELRRLEGITYLRIGEQENCILDHTIDSCLLPIRDRGIHRLQRGSRAAVGIYRDFLEEDPGDLSSRWLLNIAYMTLGEYPQSVPEDLLVPPSVFDSDFEIERFRDVAPETGVAHLSNAGGSAIEDFNGDGYLDLVASSWGPTDPLRYFENRGDGGFTDRTDAAGLSGQTGGINLVHADYDNDGRPDLLVLRGAWLGDLGVFPNSLLRNLGGTFEDVTEQAGILSFLPTNSAAWGDFDNDGWLDLFVANESRSRERPCELFRNNGDGTFTEAGKSVGLQHTGFVKGAGWGDYDNDGRIDLFLSRFDQANILYHNDGPREGGGWSFTDVSAAAGITAPIKSFPTWFFDYDNDGWLDLTVASLADFHSEGLEYVVSDYLDLPTGAARCRLYRNRGDGTFEDVSRETGFDRVLLAMGANFGDLDNDGFLDAYFGTGVPALYTLVPNVMLRNDGGDRFQDVTTAGGFGSIQKGHGIAFGDLDNDGDQDIYAAMGGAYSGDEYQNILFENPGFGNRWVTLRLEGVRSNRSAIGARVRVITEQEDGKVREIHRVVGTGGSFGSSSLQLEIGLGRAVRITSMEIQWPATGERSLYELPPLDRIVRIREGDPGLEVVDSAPIALGGTPMHRH